MHQSFVKATRSALFNSRSCRPQRLQAFAPNMQYTP
uniref:Uncharacterized protein n=1 Tax=Anguilla anguilla TaxID=7936 RepID=A0A0E9WEA5_ANGAN